MSGKLWWIKQGLLLLLAGFFLMFGIDLLLAAYKLKDPFAFIMTFFASNLIILINGALLTGFVCRMITAYKRYKKRLKEEG